LLDALGQHQDTAYQRLFEWVKLKCDSLTESGSSAEDIDVKLQIAVRFLRDLPVYFAQCQDLVISSRRTQLVQRFVVALTQGGPLGQVFRAIDMHAHDSVRYVGDMLAWMHQTIAGETEFLEAVFGDQTDPSTYSTSRRKSPGTPRNRKTIIPSQSEVSPDTDEGSNKVEGALSLEELLVRSLQGLGRPLRVRIMQTLEARQALEVLYPLTDLLSFYEQTLQDIIPRENAVHSAVRDCLQECKQLFLSSLNKQAETLVQSPSSYPLDLTTAMSTRECAKQIQEVLRVHDTALSSVPSDPLDECHVDNVLGCIIQPLLQSCRVGGQALRGADMAIFMLNNVAAIKHELREGARQSDSTQRATSSWLAQLAEETNIWVQVLVREETERTLKRSDLDSLVELVDVLLATRDTDTSLENLCEVLDELPLGLGQERVAGVLRAFYSSLFSSVAPHFDRLQDPEIREITRTQSADAVAAAYDKVYKVVYGASRHYDPSILAHTVDEVRVLLGCSS